MIAKNFGEVLDGVALGGPHYLLRLVEDSTGTARTCWVEPICFGWDSPMSAEVEHGSTVDDGERLDDLGQSDPGDWVGRRLVAMWEGGQLEGGTRFVWEWAA